jgi:beta-glucanase (GH16 family)
MDKAHVAISTPGILTLTAQRITGQPPATHAGKQIPINYLSGAVGARQKFTVATGGTLVFSASFLAPVAKGTWPAFWLTGVASWPPEIDMAEWKGSGKISFNAFNSSSVAATKDVVYAEPGRWHDVKCELKDNGSGVARVKYWMDGKEVVTQYGKGVVGKEMYLVINLQMEGSSGAQGPGVSEYMFFCLTGCM